MINVLYTKRLITSSASVGKSSFPFFPLTGDAVAPAFLASLEPLSVAAPGAGFLAAPGLALSSGVFGDGFNAAAEAGGLPGAFREPPFALSFGSSVLALKA